MGKGSKEDEKIERTIRSLLKIPENKRCINCNSLGPQYVCTTFMTFVCTNCSGVHREFTHRVKSMSMAKFNAEEVSALQAGGNERVRQIYFKDWDPQYHSYPDARYSLSPESKFPYTNIFNVHNQLKQDSFPSRPKMLAVAIFVGGLFILV